MGLKRRYVIRNLVKLNEKILPIFMSLLSFQTGGKGNSHLEDEVMFKSLTSLSIGTEHYINISYKEKFIDV